MANVFIICVGVILCLESAFCQFGFFNQDREERRYGNPLEFGQNILNGAGKITGKLAGFLNLGPQSQNDDRNNNRPFNRPYYDNRRPQTYPYYNGNQHNEYYNPYHQNQNIYNRPNTQDIIVNEDTIKDLVNEAKSNNSPAMIIIVEDDSLSEVNKDKLLIPTNPPFSQEISYPKDNPATSNQNYKNTYEPSSIVVFPDTIDNSQVKPGIPDQPPPVFELVDENPQNDEGKHSNKNDQSLPSIIFEKPKETNQDKPGIPTISPEIFDMKYQPGNNLPEIPTLPPIVFEYTDKPKEHASELPPLTPVPSSSSFEHENEDTTKLPELTPVPSSESRNNFNFGTAGLFKETCQTVDESVGSCLSLYDCPEYLKILKSSRSNPAAIQLLRRAHCGFDGKNPKVCCPRASIPTAPPPTSETIIYTPEPKSIDSSSVLPEPPVCGFSNASLSRVVGGVDAKLGDFPWMALLGYKGKRHPGTRWLCGGSLITHQHVLTASHCVHNHEDDLYVVRLGELDLESTDEGATPIDVPITRKIKHEGYSSTSISNDIAILVLEAPVQFTDLIKPICLPMSSDLRGRSFENYTPIIAGWGDLEFRGPASPRLQALQLPVVGNDKCRQAYRNYKKQQIDERVVCAGYVKGGKDACQGDSGGPLMQPIWDSNDLSTYFYQIGVVSFGKGCAEAGFPGVYTRVTHFIPWIEEKIAETS